ncbi:MAG: D-3-phosphoglycerate dehydrogenase [Lentisphaerae bacterium ADurb.Bin242]|nr:MAG: D-3-phosphoglycerate dehydrogenase [Lentisphaerae bacterium ADurb.Bin242]
MKKVIIPTKLDKEVARILGDAGFEVIQLPEKPVLELARENADAEVIIVRSEKVTPEVMDALPSLKLVVRAGAGYDNIDTQYARRKNVDVMNTPGANSNAVAEEVVALALAAYRQVVPADVSTREGKWEKSKFMGRELTGKTVGILGLGHIGRLLARRLSGFEVTVLAFDPVLSTDMAAQLGVKLCTVEEIFAQSDIISLHIPENDSTRGMVNAKLLGLMKKGAMLINCARSGIVDEDAIRAVKAEKQLLFCNDVYKKDAEGPKSVADIADVMLPHLGANTKEANFLAAKRAAEQTVAYFAEGVTTSVVNKGVPDGMDEKFQSLASLLAGVSAAYLGEDAQIRRIETSFYGKLHAFGKWMLAPITAGIAKDFDPYLGAADAMEFLKARGIEMKDREVDNEKHYGESITIDLITNSGNVSVRGTLTESHLMLSRINNFDKIYLELSGNNLFVEYGDTTGIIGKIASLLGANAINIIDIRAPQDLERNHSLAVIKTNVPVPAELIEQIRDQIKAVKAFSFSC